MIDTDKYEGHTPGPWKRAKAQITTQFCGDKIIVNTGATSWEADMHLIADAPLLLDFIVWVKNTHPHYYHKLTEAYQSAKNNR